MWKLGYRQPSKLEQPATHSPSGEKDKDILARVKKGEVKFDPADWSDVSSDAIDFIKFTGQQGI